MTIDDYDFTKRGNGEMKRQKTRKGILIFRNSCSRGRLVSNVSNVSSFLSTKPNMQTSYAIKTSLEKLARPTRSVGSVEIGTTITKDRSVYE